MIGGIFTVTGNVFRPADNSGDTFDVQGLINGGKLIVDGTFSLGGAVINAANGGVIQLATVSTLAGGADTITVDSSSSLEIGAAHAAQTGAFTLDAGSALLDGGSITAPVIVNNGTIEVGAGETLALDGTGTGLIGTGLVQIDAGARLSIEAVGKLSQNQVRFAGAGGALVLSHASLNASLVFVPVVSGFNAADRIVYQGDVSDVSFAGNTLTLANNGAPVATLTLAGSYAGDTFFANDLGGQTQIAMSVGGDTPVAPNGTLSQDHFVWGASVAGSWDNPANWSDATAGQTPALVAPGKSDLVTIASTAGATDIITGTGEAASLSLGGAIDLKGQVKTGDAALVDSASLLIDTAASLTVSGHLDEASSDRLTVDGATLAIAGGFNVGTYCVNTVTNATLTVGGSLVDVSQSALILNDASATIGGNLEEASLYNAVTLNDSTVAISGDLLQNAGVLTVNGGRLTVANLQLASGATQGDAISVTAGLFHVTGSIGSGAAPASNTVTVSGEGQFMVDGKVALGSDTIQASGSGVVRFGSAATGANSTDTFETIGTTASIEIGGAGRAAAGSFTLDAGQSLTDGGAIYAAQIMLSTGSVLTAGANETLTLYGNPGDLDTIDSSYPGVLAGAGALQIGAGATLNIYDLVATGSGLTVHFIADGGVLGLNPYALSTAAFIPVISGFNTTDRILYQGDVSDVSFSGNTLTLSNNGAAVATLTLDGNYAGDTFAANDINGTTQITVLGSDDTSQLPPGTSTPDLYVWSALSGSWDRPANWSDTTAGQTPALLAPGHNDQVTIGSTAGATDIVTCAGDSASLSLSGSIDLKGQFRSGVVTLADSTSLIVDTAASLNVSGHLDEASTDRLTVNDATLAIAGDFNAGTYGVNAVTNATVTVGGSLVEASQSTLTLNSATVAISGNLEETSLYNAVTLNDSTLAISGNLLQNAGGVTVNGGRLTVVNIQAVSGAAQGDAFSVTAGLFHVTGSITGGATPAGANFTVSGDGQFIVDGNVALGSDAIQASGSGVVRFDSVTTQANSTDTFENIGTTASIEIGNTGAAAPGSFTLDAGQTLTDGGAIYAAQILLASGSVLTAGAGEVLTLNGDPANNASVDNASPGALAGSGALQIGAGATLNIYDLVATGSTLTVHFAADGGVLGLNPYALSTGAFIPVISGFNATDRILYQGDVSDVSFSGHTLTLSNNGAPVATLTLAGSYAGDTFFANDVGGQTQISVSVGGDTSKAPKGTPSVDQYVWTPSVAGSWDNPANWSDSTASLTPALLSPGQNDQVTIASTAGAIDIVTGAGDAASLALSGSIDLKGQFKSGDVSLVVGTSLIVDAAGSLLVTGDVAETGNNIVTLVDAFLTVGGNLVEASHDSLTLNNASADISGNLDETSLYNAVTLNASTLAISGDLLENGGDLTLNGGRLTVANVQAASGANQGDSFSVTAGLFHVTGSISGPTPAGNSVSVSGDGQFIVDGNVALGSDTIQASGSGAVRFDSVTTSANSNDTFEISSTTASIEIGNTGAAAAGSFTLDSGQTLTDGGAIYAAQIMLASGSVLTAGAGETLTLYGNPGDQDTIDSSYPGVLAGAGALQIGADARLNLYDLVATGSTLTVHFTADGGVLGLNPYALSTGAFIPVISGFNTTDRILYQGDLSDVTFSGHTLTLSNNGAAVATLTLDGNFAGDTFFTNDAGGQTQISVSVGGDTPQAPKGASSPDQYVWTPSVAGSWDLADNWTDITSGDAPASTAPGANNLVAVVAPTGEIYDVTGKGAAAALTLSNAELWGSVSTGAVSQNGDGLTTLAASATLDDSGDYVFGGSSAQLTVNGGALHIGGNLVEDYGDVITLTAGSITADGLKTTIGSYYTGNQYNIAGGVFHILGSVSGIGPDYAGGDSFQASGTGYFQVSGVFALGSEAFDTTGSGRIQLASTSSLPGGTDTFSVANESSIEIGTTGAPIAGSFTLDAGRTLTEGGAISAPYIAIDAGATLRTGNNATLALDGDVVGQGALEIDNGATISIANALGGSNQTHINFAGTDGTLVLTAIDSELTVQGAFLPTITGFGAGDSIELDDGTVSDVSYSNGKLTLLDGAVAVGVLTLTGAYAGATFNVAQGFTSVITVSSGGDAAPVIAAPPSIKATENTLVPVVGLAVYDATVVPAMTVTLTATNGVFHDDTSAPSGGGKVTGSGTGVLTLSGSIDEINADLTTLSYETNKLDSDTITISAANGIGGVTTQDVSVTVNAPPPGPLQVTAPSSIAAGLGQARSISGISLSQSNTTASEIITATLTDANGLLSATGAEATGSGSTSLTLSGSLTAVNAALATLQDVDATAGADTITLAVTDGLGDSAAASISVAINGSPVIAGPTSVTVDEGETSGLPGLTVSESGSSADEIFTLTLTDTAGLLSAAGIGVAGSGSTILTITGSLPQVNADLATLVDLVANASADTLHIALSDGLGNQADASVAIAARSLPLINVTGQATNSGGGGQSNAVAYGPDGSPLAQVSKATYGNAVVIEYFTGAGVLYAATILQDLGGGASEVQDFNGSWGQKDATITYDLGGGSTLVESFDGGFNHTGAVLTRVVAGGSIVQTFDGNWSQQSAEITTNFGGGVTVTQDFDGLWNQTAAKIVDDNGAGLVVTQTFDGQWQQVSASISTALGGGSSEMQYFDAHWNQLSASITQHPSSNVTETQYFDAHFKQTSAEIDSIYGNQTYAKLYDGSWTLTGGVVTTVLGANADLVQTYDANWNLLADEDRLVVTGRSAVESFADTPGLPTTYVFHPGDINGDAFASFTSDAQNAAAHDVLEFVGYGAGAAVTAIDAGHWQISAPGRTTEVFTLAAALNPAAGDVVFL